MTTNIDDAPETLEAQRDEAVAIIRAFLIEIADYMWRNRLGDPLDQHNVRRATDFLSRIEPDVPED